MFFRFLCRFHENNCLNEGRLLVSNKIASLFHNAIDLKKAWFRLGSILSDDLCNCLTLCFERQTGLEPATCGLGSRRSAN